MNPFLTLSISLGLMHWGVPLANGHDIFNPSHYDSKDVITRDVAVPFFALANKFEHHDVPRPRVSRLVPIDHATYALVRRAPIAAEARSVEQLERAAERRPVDLLLKDVALYRIARAKDTTEVRNPMLRVISAQRDLDKRWVGCVGWTVKLQFRC